MTIATAITTELETLLNLIAEELQLPSSLDEKARQRYGALTSYLESSRLGRFPISVYAQGSYRIGTTVKPLSGEEFDLDFILELVLPELVSPNDLVEAVWTEMQRNGNYRGMLKRLPSCIRLVYADEFHMDVVPAVPDAEHGQEGILIPRENASVLAWHATNPRGYAGWFESKASTRILTKELMVEPLPPAAPADEKTPLQTCVQLYKRNHQFRVPPTHLRTPSIVLTTIAGESARPGATLGETMGMLTEALQPYTMLPEPPRLSNPAAPHETISENWADTRVFDAFKAHANRLIQDWQELLSLQGRDIMALARKLSEMFGESPVERAFKAAEGSRQAARTAGVLSTGAGGILYTKPTPRPNPRHTYFGGRQA